jgi:hypothetical protein
VELRDATHKTVCEAGIQYTKFYAVELESGVELERCNAEWLHAVELRN